MEVIRALESVQRPPDGCAITIGVYDGVHRGHVAVIRQVRAVADERGLRTAVVTFDRHPGEIVHPASAPRLLTTLDQRIELLDALGMLDYCCVLTFDEDRRKETAEEFVREILVGRLHARAVVVGRDFHFGYARRGDVPMLEEMGGELGYGVVGLDLIRVAADPAVEGSNVYSSTLIRSLVTAGNMGAAARLLGRYHEVRGTVERGDRRGHELGFPTANVAISERVCMPADGIYGGFLVTEDGVERPAAISLGKRPTFYEEQVGSLLEVHVLDFSGDLYDQEVSVRFVAKLRGEERFDSVEALIDQIHQDVIDVRLVLAGRAEPPV